MINSNKIIYAYNIKIDVHSDDYGFEDIDVTILSDMGSTFYHYSTNFYDMKDIGGGYLFWFRPRDSSKIVYVFISEYVIWR